MNEVPLTNRWAAHDSNGCYALVRTERRLLAFRRGAAWSCRAVVSTEKLADVQLTVIAASTGSNTYQSELKEGGLREVSPLYP